MERAHREAFPLPDRTGTRAGASVATKILSLIVRRPDLDRAAFAEHYDHRHAPLALDLLPDAFASYRRNHVVEPADTPFDCVSEFRFRDREAMEAVFALLASDAARPIHEDEERFMDRPRNTFYPVEEEIVRARRGGEGASAVGVWALSEGDPVDRAAAMACIHNHAGAPSRPDGPAWKVLTELWYADAETWARDRAAWEAEPGAVHLVRAVRVRESVSIPPP